MSDRTAPNKAFLCHGFLAVHRRLLFCFSGGSFHAFRLYKQTKRAQAKLFAWVCRGHIGVSANLLGFSFSNLRIVIFARNMCETAFHAFRLYK